MGNGVAGMLNTTMYYTAIHDIIKAVITDQRQIEGSFILGYCIYLRLFLAIVKA